MSTDKFIGATEAAKVLGLSRSGFNRRVTNGLINPFDQIGGRTYIFDRAEIEALACKEAAK